MERLNPVERAAYLLREVFGYEYVEIAAIIERTEVNARQLVTRARKHLEARRPRFDADEAARDALLERFLAAAEEGDLEALEELLAKDAVLYADGGGKAMAPAEPIVGAALIARFMAPWRGARRSGDIETRLVRVNGQPGRVVRGPDEADRRGRADRRGSTQAQLRSGDIDAEQLAALIARGAARRAGQRRDPGPERAHRGRRRWPDPGGARRAQPGQARSSLSCHRTAGCAVRPPNSRTRQENHMSTVTVQPFSGLYRAQAAPSSFAFAVRHSGVFWFRGSLSDVEATLHAEGDALVLEGSAGVESISIVAPGRHAGQRPRPGVLRRRAASPHHVPLDRRPSGRGRPGGGGRRAHDPGRDAPDQRRGHYAAPRRPASARSPDCSCARTSTAASSASTGRRSCRAAGTRSAGTSRWTSTCC